MTPKEKAKELYDKMYFHFRTVRDSDICKQCALIAVETVILNCYEEEEYYWKEVKQEIELL